MSNQRIYTGHSGQMAVMAELLFRGCNVAVPDIDLGTDVFAFRDAGGDVARIQVKTARGDSYQRGQGYRASFSIPLKQLGRPDKPPLYYAFAVRLAGRWGDFLVISRLELNGYWNGDRRFGTENPRSGCLDLTIQFRPESVRCGEIDLTSHRTAWEGLPPFRPLPVVEPELILPNLPPPPASSPEGEPPHL